ncbi:hypothetical protein D3C81_2052320 [compost metagenome]
MLTASASIPAKTVTSFAGCFSFFTAAFAAGRAFAAAQPQTELTTTKTVPSEAIAESTASGVFNSSNPASTNS